MATLPSSSSSHHCHCHSSITQVGVYRLAADTVRDPFPAQLADLHPHLYYSHPAVYTRAARSARVSQIPTAGMYTTAIYGFQVYLFIFS